jgi:hypothetical protein
MDANDRHTPHALGQAQALGDLVSATLSQPLRDPNQWVAIEEKLARPHPRWPLLAAALGATALVVIGLGVRTLHYDAHDLRAVDGSLVADTEGALTFDEGTRISLGANAHARVHGFSFRRGARLELQSGHATLAVVHRRLGRWQVAAGPFDIDVTGTRFDVDWQPSQGQFDVRVTEGEVRVSGGPLQPRTPVRAGQRLSVLRNEVTLARLDAQPSVVEPRVPAVQPAPAASAELSAPLAASRPRKSRRQARRVADAPAALERPRVAAAAPVDPVPPAPIEPTPAPIEPTPAPIEPAPNLIPGSTGPLWIDGGAGTSFAARHYLEDGVLCTKGNIPALTCTNAGTSSIHCDWGTNWGALLGWKTRSDGGAWGSGAAAKLAVDYRGRGTRIRLIAHRRGDPPAKTYCVSGYRSGRTVEPSQFKTECWENRGASLSSFADVDRFAVQVASEESAQPFRICVSAVHLF